MYTQGDNPRVDESRRSGENSSEEHPGAIVNKLHFNNMSSHSKSHRTSQTGPRILSAIGIFLSTDRIPNSYSTMSLCKFCWS